MKITTDLEECIRGAELLVLAVPSPFTRSTAHAMAPYVEKGQIIVNVAKGIEEGTAHLRNPPGNESRLGIVSVAQAVGNSGRQGNHVFQGSSPGFPASGI